MLGGWGHDHSGVIMVLQASEYTKEMKEDLRKRHMSIKSDQRNSVVHEMMHNVFEHMDEEKAVTIITGLLNP